MSFRQKSRYKIYYQTRDNIYGTSNLKKFNKKKWSFLKKNQTTAKRSTIFLSNFFKDLLHSRQKLKHFYGNLKEYQFLNLYKLALKEKKKNYKKSFIPIFLQLLESRLDIVIYRLHYTSSIYGAQQIIKQGKILVNNKPIVTPSFCLKYADYISVNPTYKSKIKKNIILNLEKNSNYILELSHFEFNLNTVSCIFLPKPLGFTIKYPFNLNHDLLEFFYKLR
jgi:ribosomal protein S4